MPDPAAPEPAPIPPGAPGAPAAPGTPAAPGAPKAVDIADVDWLGRLRHRFVVFDGPDGSGKSTQFRRFVRYVEAAGIEVCEVREPGGTELGEQVRDILLSPRNTGRINILCEMMLFMASRAQLVTERVQPALEAGHLVLADRFISSTLAYQGTAGGLPIEDIRRVGDIALGGRWPDLVVVFDVDEATAGHRLNPLLDRMESKGAAFHRKVRQGYHDQVAAEPGRYAMVDARPEADAVFASLLATLRERSTGWDVDATANPSTAATG